MDQHGQVIDIYVSKRHNIAAARRFFKTTLLAHDKPVEVVTDLAQALETVIEEQIPRAFHNYDYGTIDFGLQSLATGWRRGRVAEGTAS